MSETDTDVLEKLIETCRDGQEGYREAAQYIRDPETRTWFNEVSLQRARFAGELENYVRRQGKADPERKGSISAAIRHRWFEVKEKVMGSDESVLEEVERGEDNAKQMYEESINKELPADVLQLVRRQAQSIFAAHDQVKEIRVRAKRAA